MVTTRDVVWIEYTPRPTLNEDSSASSTEQGENGVYDEQGRAEEPKQSFSCTWKCFGPYAR